MASRTALGLLRIRLLEDRRAVDSAIGRTIRTSLELAEGDADIVKEMNNIAESQAVTANRIDRLIKAIDAKLR